MVPKGGKEVDPVPPISPFSASLLSTSEVHHDDAIGVAFSTRAMCPCCSHNFRLRSLGRFLGVPIPDKKKMHTLDLRSAVDRKFAKKVRKFAASAGDDLPVRVILPSVF